MMFHGKSLRVDKSYFRGSVYQIDVVLGKVLGLDRFARDMFRHAGAPVRSVGEVSLDLVWRRCSGLSAGTHLARRLPMSLAHRCDLLEGGRGRIYQPVTNLLGAPLRTQH